MIQKSRLPLCFAILATAILVLPISSMASDDPKKAVVECVSSEMSAFSGNDRATFVDTYVDSPSILDDVAPFTWSNAGSWFDTVRPLFREVTMKPGKPLEVLIDSNRAFIALPFTIIGEGAGGKPFKGSGYWSGELVSIAGSSWRIASAAITLTE
jgi:hypothetical protein